MRSALKNLLLLCALSSAVGIASAVDCAPADKEGGPLTGSREDGSFVTCVYQLAGACTYFPADGSFSSGSSDCPKGLPQGQSGGGVTSQPTVAPAPQTPSPSPSPPAPVPSSSPPAPPVVTPSSLPPPIIPSPTIVGPAPGPPPRPTTQANSSPSSSGSSSSSASLPSQSSANGNANAALPLTGGSMLGTIVGLAGLVAGMNIF